MEVGVVRTADVKGTMPYSTLPTKFDNAPVYLGVNEVITIVEPVVPD
jgi:hypothetical protein